MSRERTTAGRTGNAPVPRKRGPRGVDATLQPHGKIGYDDLHSRLNERIEEALFEADRCPSVRNCQAPREQEPT